MNEAQRTPTIVRCDPRQERAALALAADAWPVAERAAYGKAIGTLLDEGHAERVVLLAARLDGDVVAAQIGQSLPGRVAAVWAPCFAANCHIGRETIAALLQAEMMPALAATGADIVQALLTPTDQVAAELLSLGGLRHAADLLYLAAETDQVAASPPALSFELESFRFGDEARLGQLIERTYVGTLDCPGIDGLRKTADVLAGYKSVGQFHPELWLVVRHNGADVGCLLLNLHLDVNHAEIIYLALAPEVRGRGWGLALAQHAQWLARVAGCDRVVLAVDAQNCPAIALYSEAGFFQFDRRAVWIRSLPEIPNALPGNQLSA